MADPIFGALEEPAAEELSDVQLLQMAAEAIGLASIGPGEYEDAMGPEGDYSCALEVYGSELIAYGRAVAAATRAALAAQPQVGGAEGDWFTIASIAQDMRSRGLAEQSAGDELLRLAAQPQAPAPASDTPLDIDALLSPRGAYEPGTGHEDGAQLVDQVEWWAPVYGCDTLENLLDQIHARILPHLRPPIAGIDVPGPDGDHGDLLDLCAAEGVDPRIGAPLLKRAREAWGKPEPSHDVEGEIEALMRTHSSVEPVMGAGCVLCEAAFGTVAREIAARWGRPPATPEPTSPNLAEAREAARQLAGPAAEVVHRFLNSLPR